MKRRLVLLVSLAILACRQSTRLELPQAPPASLSASSLRGAIELRWEDVPGAAGYVVHASSSGNAALGRSFDALPPWTMPLDTSFQWSFAVSIRGSAALSAEVSARPLPSALFTDPLALTPPGFPPRFGAAIDIADADGDGDADLLVGAPSLGAQGAAGLFLGSNGMFSPTPVWVTTGGGAYGTAVAIAADFNGDRLPDLAVGDPDTNPAVRIFLGNLAPFSTSENQIVLGVPGSGFGSALEARGDISHDDLSDLLVALPYSSGSIGSLTLLSGSPNGIGAPIWTYAPNSSDDEPAGLGQHGATITGDVNGDGHPDVVVGSDDQKANTRLLLGGATAPSQSPNWRPGQNTGLPGGAGSVSDAGDLNCDGFADIVARVSNYQNSAGEAIGALNLYFGTPTLPADQPDVVLPGTGSSQQLLRPLSIADVDGDGCADIVMGANSGAAGELQVFLGSPPSVPFALTPAWRFTQDISGTEWGSVVKAADINGDGLADVAVATPRADTIQIFLARPTRGPIVDAGPAQQIDAGESAMFSLAHFSDPIHTSNVCTWDWDDGTPPTTISPCVAAAQTHVYATAGIFHPLLTVSSDMRTGTARTRVQVNP